MAPRRSHNTVRVASAAQRLPPELLLECLRAADLPTRVRASHVSRRWRAIALSDRRLWDSFSCSHFRSVQHQDAMFNKLQAMLIRSRSLPFRLHIPHQRFGPFVKFWLTLLGLEQLDVRRLASYDGPWVVFARLISDRTPLAALASLNIVEPNVKWDNGSIQLAGTFNGPNFPNLRSLEAPFVRFSAHSRPFASVLHLTCSLDHDSHLERLFDVFPNIVHLQVNAIDANVCFPPVSLPASLRTVELCPTPGSELDVEWILRNWEGARIPQFVPHDAGTAQGVLPLFLAMHPHPIELRLNGRDGEIVLSALAGEKLTWAIPPSHTALATFVKGLEICDCERLTSISVALEELGRLFVARLHAPSLERMEFRLDGAKEVPLPPPGKDGSFICAPRLKRVELSLDARSDLSDARMNEIHGILIVLSTLFRALISYDADLLESVALYAPAACVQLFNSSTTYFACLAKAYTVCATR